MLAATPEALHCAIPEDAASVELIGATRAAMLHSLQLRATSGPLLGNGAVLIDYLVASMASEPRETLRVLFLDATLHLIRDEVVAVGTIREAPAYPREIMRRSFELGAAAIILAHNHPSGDPSPSAQDIALTRRLARIGSELDVVVQDHILIARSGWSSLRALGLLEP